MITASGKPKFPTVELKAWLKGRMVWHHDNWLALLADLHSKGYVTLTETQAGRDSIGIFLETHRSKQEMNVFRR